MIFNEAGQRVRARRAQQGYFNENSVAPCHFAVLAVLPVVVAAAATAAAVPSGELVAIIGPLAKESLFNCSERRKEGRKEENVSLKLPPSTAASSLFIPNCCDATVAAAMRFRFFFNF